MPTLRIIVPLLLCVTSACATAAPSVDALLAAGPDSEYFQDARLRWLRVAAAAPAAGPEAWMEAARALFQGADLRIQSSIHAELERHPPASLQRLLDVEDRLGPTVRGEVLALCREGRTLAQRVLGREPRHPGALLFLALHTSQIAWSKTTLQALTGGWGPRTASTINAALEGDAERESAAPLRLKGRFLGRAPWPYRDTKEALRLLEAAAAAAPVAINWLFLGDARHAAGDPAGARAAWQRAADAPAGGASQAALEQHHKRARRRLQLSRRADT